MNNSFSGYYTWLTKSELFSEICHLLLAFTIPNLLKYHLVIETYAFFFVLLYLYHMFHRDIRKHCTRLKGLSLSNIFVCFLKEIGIKIQIFLPSS